VVTTNVKVTDLGSKEADEDEVWKLKFGEETTGTRRRTPIYLRLLCQNERPIHALCGSFIKH
jgi:hypothetical protein